MKKYLLSVGAILCNESMIVSEWIQHYIDEGVEHFYLIENNSTDAYSSFDIIQDKYSKYVTYFRNDARYAQEHHYNHYFKIAVQESEWLMIVDLDEFVYARNPFNTILEYIQKIHPMRIDQIMIPWKMYGSSGFKDQPENVIHYFVMRQIYDGKITSQAMRNHKDINVKSIVRTSSVISFRIHSHYLKPNSISRRSNYQICRSDDWLPTTEEMLKTESLHLNHYAIQSLEFFTKIKMARGSATNPVENNIRNMNYFNRYDSNRLLDDELSSKKKNSSNNLNIYL